jgi:hypothetical protein
LISFAYPLDLLSQIFADLRERAAGRLRALARQPGPDVLCWSTRSAAWLSAAMTVAGTARGGSRPYQELNS